MNIGTPGGLLHLASLHGRMEVVRLLLENHADINRQAGVFGRLLQAALTRGHKATVKLLLENNANVNAQGGRHESALMAAIMHGHNGVVKLLLESHADVNSRTTTQLGLPIKGGDHGGTVQKLCDKEEDNTDAVEVFSYVLHVASHMGHTNIVKILLTHCADVNARAQEGSMAAHFGRPWTGDMIYRKSAARARSDATARFTTEERLSKPCMGTKLNVGYIALATTLSVILH